MALGQRLRVVVRLRPPLNETEAQEAIIECDEAKRQARTAYGELCALPNSSDGPRRCGYAPMRNQLFWLLTSHAGLSLDRSSFSRS